MKELSIEEKAKAYDEAIKVARQYYNDKVMPIGTDFKLEKMFPELKESEGERIRKELIDYLKERKSCESYGQYVVRYDRWIAWLEKQGEQKPISEHTTNHKFEKGDWIISNKGCDCANSIMYINQVELDEYLCIEQDGQNRYATIFIDENYHSMTAREILSILNKQKSVKWSKEIREEFERKYNEGKAVGIEIGKNEIQNSVEWSETDEWRFSKICNTIRLSPNCNCEDDDWLKSIKDRVQQQPNLEWSEEDEKMISMAITDLNLAHDVVRKGVAEKERKKEIEWLKSLKDRCLYQFV